MRLKKSSIAVLTALTMIIAGCSYGLGGRMSGDGSAESTVTFSVTDIPTNYLEMIREAQNPASRSILPNAPFGFSSGLTFVLTGKSNTGSTFPATPVNLDPTTHKFNIVLSAGVWDLTLTAYKDYPPPPSPPPLKPVLQGHCTVDLTNNNGTATFAMSTKGLTTPGTVKVTGAVLDPLNICTKYKIGIYNAYSGKLIDTYKDIDGLDKQTNAKQEKATDTHTGQFNFHYGDTAASPADLVVTLNPGAYTFLMVFYKGAGTTADPHVAIGSYADTIVVDPGNDLVRPILPNPLDVLNKEPTDPANLRAYLVDGSEDTEGGYYRTKLTWDSSMFETNYELELSTYPDDGTSTSPAKTVYGFYETETATEKNFAGSLIRYDGSLVSGSHECTLKLELGKVYEVKLRARNYIGESNWVERNVADVTTSHAGYTFIDFPTMTDPKKHINRRRIRYHLNGGTLTLNKGPSQETINGIYVSYDSYQGTAKDLLTISPSSSLTGNTLVKGTDDFSGWLNPNTGVSVTHDHTSSTIPPDHTDFYKHVNVDLATDFGNGLEGIVTLPGTMTDIPDSKIKITYEKQDGSGSGTPTPSGTHLIIPKRIGMDISFIKVEFNGLSPANEYTDMECTAYFTSASSLGVSQVTFKSEPDGKNCKFSTATYPTRTFVLMVSAYNASHTRLSRTFLIDLRN